MLWHLWYHWLGVRLSLLDPGNCERGQRAHPNMSSLYKLMDPEPAPLNHHLYQILPRQATVSPALSQPGSGTRQPVRAPMPQSPQELFRLASLTLSILPCLAFPTDSLIKAVASAFWSLLSPSCPWCFPMGPGMTRCTSLCQGSVSTNLLLRDIHSHDCVSYQNWWKQILHTNFRKHFLFLITWPIIYHRVYLFILFIMSLSQVECKFHKAGIYFIFFPLLYLHYLKWFLANTGPLINIYERNKWNINE